MGTIFGIWKRQHRRNSVDMDDLLDVIFELDAERVSPADDWVRLLGNGDRHDVMHPGLAVLRARDAPIRPPYY